MLTNTSILFLCPADTPHVTQLRTAFAFPENDPDIHWLVDDTQEEWSPPQIESVRTMISEMALQPYHSEKSTFIVPHIDRASIPAQNALLKSLEEPPEHVQIILTASQIENVLPTIVSRCIVQRGTETNTPIDEQEVKQLLTTAKISEIITLSETYKERDTAIAALDHAVRYLHEQPPTQQRVQQLNIFLHAIDLLRKNVNVRLVVEDALFSLR